MFLLCKDFERLPTINEIPFTFSIRFFLSHIGSLGSLWLSDLFLLKEMSSGKQNNGLHLIYESKVRIKSMTQKYFAKKEIVIIMEFLLHKSIIYKILSDQCSLKCSYIFIKVVETRKKIRNSCPQSIKPRE